MKLTHIVGARPNFMKAAPVVEALDTFDLDQELVHTGQHYDAALSQVFFDELGLPAPDRHLGIGSATQAVQTARLLEALEADFVEHDPDGVVVYGDVNSTLAAALAAAKLQIPIAHVEAGLRSFDRTMPEEINRVITDSLSQLHLVTSAEAIDHLRAEGVQEGGIHFVGNSMIDTLDKVMPELDSATIRSELGITDDYALVTMHRPANVDDTTRARAIVTALGEVAEQLTVVFPIHPRGRGSLGVAGVFDIDNVITTEPLGYIDFTALMSDAVLVITDSGGIQEETTVLGVPCLTVRPNTERPVTITTGTNQLIEPADMADATREILDGSRQPAAPRPPLWDGHAAERIAPILSDWMSSI